jgi:hypothetical protein
MKMQIKKIAGYYQAEIDGKAIYNIENLEGEWVVTCGDFGDKNYWMENYFTKRDALEAIKKDIGQQNS